MLKDINLCQARELISPQRLTRHLGWKSMGSQDLNRLYRTQQDRLSRGGPSVYAIVDIERKAKRTEHLSALDDPLPVTRDHAFDQIKICNLGPLYIKNSDG
jgi:hypothetical protein